MQTQFMGLRPDGWLEELEAKKQRHRRKVRMRIIVSAACIVLVAACIWGAFAWA